MALWIMAHDGRPYCPHAPNLAGTACELCGMPAEPQRTPADRADFARELTAAYADAVARAEGQASWLD